MNYFELDTPVMIIDREIMIDNIKRMQDYANSKKVTLRPHTKTHKTPELALLQESMGAKGIAVAKVGEAEVMSAYGLKDIFIANEIVGDIKLQRIRKLAETIDISFGLDSIAQAEMVERNFKGASKPAEVLIEIEVGEERSGVIEFDDFKTLLSYLKNNCPNIHLKGIFSHDGNSYSSRDLEACSEIHLGAQRRTLEFAEIAKEMGLILDTVSIGSTPSLMHDFHILKGITEIRPGTYILMDASQGNAYGSMKRCAATVLATVISLPTSDRIILDVGAKGITTQKRTKGICAVEGMGRVKQFPNVNIFNVYDEHAIIYSREMHDAVKVGDKVEIIPVHICPVMNLHESAYLVSKGQVVKELPILCRGKLK